MELIQLNKEEEIKNQLLNIIDKRMISTVFQPIISLRDASVLGHEVLSRGPKNTLWESPMNLFYYAVKYDMLWDLELVCRTKSLEALQKENVETKLFLNVNPNIIHDIKFRQGFTKQYLKKFSIEPDSIIFEITERDTINNPEHFKRTVQNYKNQNYKIAIDDTGAGISGLNMISDIHPHYIKLDMNLIRDIDTDKMKQALVKSMYEFATLSGTLLIAEGIETKEELTQLIEIGVHYGQGYYIQKPNASIKEIDNDCQMVVKEANAKRNHGHRMNNIYIGHLSSPLKSLNPNIRIAQARDMLSQDPTLPGFCVTENGLVLGVITRNELFARLSAQYGFSLYSDKPISDIMSNDFLSVDFNYPIDKVSGLAMDRDPDKLYDFVTVIKDGKYHGIVTIKNLLKKYVEIEIDNAKDLSPISGLPGNLSIEKQLEKSILSERRNALLYFDLDNFKAYNDVYGFKKGDLVIKTVANILIETVPEEEFIGHIGGDDFICILSAQNVDRVCAEIIQKFDEEAQKFFNEEDLLNGFIVAKNRHGIEETFPLLSISIAGISNINGAHSFDLSKRVSEVKKVCKQQVGSCYTIVDI